MSAPPYVAEYTEAAFFGGAEAFGRVLLHVAIDLREPFEAGELQRAAEATEAAFPILGCHYQAGSWRDRWIAAPESSALRVDDRHAPDGVEAATEALVREEPDPTARRPWRVTQLRGPDTCRLVVTVSHMLADAAGALTVVRELAAHLTGEPPHPSWGERGMPRGLGQVVRALRLRDLPRLALETVLFMRLPFQFLGMARPREPWADNLGRAGRAVCRTIIVDVADGSPFKDRCRDLGCTINDALVALLAMLNGALFGRGAVGNFFTINFRPYFSDGLPRVANLSGIDIVSLPRPSVGDFAATAGAVAERTRRLKQRFAGLPAVLSNHASLMVAPHGLVRLVIRLWARWACALLNRGLLVTNIGALDPYLAPLGERATAASLVGPFMPGFAAPVITASGFRGRLTLRINGFDGPCAPQLDQIERGLRELVDGVISPPRGRGRGSS